MNNNQDSDTISNGTQGESRASDMKTTMVLLTERVSLLADRSEILLRDIGEVRIEAGYAQDAPEQEPCPLFFDTLSGAISKLEFIFDQIEAEMGAFACA